MRSTLEDLFYGNITPNSKQYVGECAMKKYQIMINDAQDALQETANEDQKALLNRMSNAYSELSSLAEVEKFIEGFRLGSRLMLEALDSDDGDLTDIA